ncbi:hypothetical protein, partial [Escherichia coli]|uniref:hypothetical protein n=1 Tax=Escherichia coli TaxID=562 RepID=UPI001BDB74AB
HREDPRRSGSFINVVCYAGLTAYVIRAHPGQEQPESAPLTLFCGYPPVMNHRNGFMCSALRWWVIPPLVGNMAPHPPA